MIRLGLSDDEKRACVARYRSEHGIGKVFILSPARFVFACEDSEQIEWAQIIQYRHFYRLLQEIDRSTLVVVNECLRTQNRSDLTYNCIRHFLQQIGALACGVVADPCTGLGMTSRMAHEFGCSFVGTELAAKRLERTIGWLLSRGYAEET